MTVEANSALTYLRQVGGYRMKGYWYQWLDPCSKTFRPDTHFDRVIERYEFDRELRRITGDALERIELMLRTSISNVMSKHGGPHWFNDPSFFTMPQRATGTAANKHRDQRQKTWRERLAVEVEQQRPHKPFIKHYRETFDEPALPPSWALSECLSFGSWSVMYPTLKHPTHRKEISRRFRVEDPVVFASWLHAFSVMRNTVFHHGRLVGSLTSVTPKSYHKQDLRFNAARARTFFATATVINYACQSISHGTCWKTELEALFDKYSEIPIESLLGFPSNWSTAPGWRAPHRSAGSELKAAPNSQPTTTSPGPQ